MNEDTKEVPLPDGVERNPDATTTQELPVVEPFPEVRLITPVKVVIPGTRSVKVETLPPHLLGDPILTMDAPVADNTPLYDQIHGAPDRPAPALPRRKVPMGDRFLIGMGAVALVMSVGVYGMVFHGWGAGPRPEKAVSATRTAQITTEEPEEVGTATSAPRPVRSPEKDVVQVVAPETRKPVHRHSVVAVTLSAAPSSKPDPTPVTERPTAPPSPKESSAPPSPSQTPAPTPDPTPSGSQSTITIPPPVTQSQSLSATPTEESTDG